MASKHKLDTRQLHKDIKKAQTKLTRASEVAMANVMANKKQVYMEFDDVEAIPYSTQATGTITISSADGNANLEAMLAKETRDIIDNTVEELNKGIRGVFK